MAAPAGLYKERNFMFQKICYRCFKEKGNYQVCPHCGYVEGTRPEQEYQLMPGTILEGRYIIGVTIGAGGFGIIYKGYDTQEEQVVAIKEFYPGRLVNRMPGESTINIFTGSQMDEYQRLRSQFEAEARSMEHFRQAPDIVNLKNYFEANGTAYIVMEYIEGILLRDYLKMSGRMSEEDAVQVGIALLGTVAKIHAKGLVHRDISPDNFFLLENNGIKLFDFGSAGEITGKMEKKEKQGGTVVKPGYAPPEQYGFQCRNAVTMDIYAVGAILYEMVTGKRPAEGSARAIKDELTVPSKNGAEVSEVMDRIIMRSLAVKPELRFSNAMEFAQALQKKKRVEMPEEEGKRRQYRTRILTGMGVSLAAIFVLLAVGTAAYLTMNNLASVELKEDRLLVWVPVDENSDMDSMVDIWVKEYQKKYQNIRLEVERIPCEEYADRLSAAKAADSLPDVFSTRGFEGDTKEDCASLKALLRSLDTEKYLFFDDYKEYYPDMREFPTGFQIGVLYENNERMKEQTGAVELSALRNEGRDTLVWADSQDMKGVYKDFAKAKTPLNAIAGDLSILKQVEKVTVEKIPAKDFAIRPITEEGRMLAVFTDTWAVNQACSKNQKNAGMLLLSYLVEDVLQEEAYLASYDSFPVNKETYEKYKEYKMNERMSFLEQYEQDMKITGGGDSISEVYLETEAEEKAKK